MNLLITVCLVLVATFFLVGLIAEIFKASLFKVYRQKMEEFKKKEVEFSKKEADFRKRQSEFTWKEKRFRLKEQEKDELIESLKKVIEGQDRLLNHYRSDY
jgi:hypothetical protein